LYHVWPLLLALLVCQVIHEAGHGVAAAIHSIPVTSVGVSLTMIFPSAFVALPLTATQDLPTRSRLRIVAAGPFHNLLLWLLLAFISWAGVGRSLFSLAGYQDTSNYGLVIVAVDSDSPLRPHLPLRSVITKVNDRVLTSYSQSTDMWISYLSNLTQASSELKLGWCANSEWYQARDHSCCNADVKTPGISCFVPLNPANFIPDRCLSPISVIHPQDSYSSKRCNLPMDCGDESICIIPRADEQLTRISVWVPNYLLPSSPPQKKN